MKISVFNSSALLKLSLFTLIFTSLAHIGSKTESLRDFLNKKEDLDLLILDKFKEKDYVYCPTNPYYGHSIHEPLEVQVARNLNSENFESQIPYHKKLEQAENKVLDELKRDAHEEASEEDKLSQVKKAKEEVKHDEMKYDLKWLIKGFDIYKTKQKKNNDFFIFQKDFDSVLNEIFLQIGRGGKGDSTIKEISDDPGSESQALGEMIERLTKWIESAGTSDSKNHDISSEYLKLKLSLLSLEYFLKFQISSREEILSKIRTKNFFFDNVARYFQKILASDTKSRNKRRHMMVTSYDEELERSPWTSNFRNLIQAFEDDDWKILSHRMIVYQFPGFKPPTLSQILMGYEKVPNEFFEKFKEFESPLFVKQMDSVPSATAEFIGQLINLSKNPTSKILGSQPEDRRLQLIFTFHAFSYFLRYFNDEQALKNIDQNLMRYGEMQKILLTRLIGIRQLISQFEYKIQNGCDVFGEFMQKIKKIGQTDVLRSQYIKGLVSFTLEKLGYEAELATTNVKNHKCRVEMKNIRQELKEFDEMIHALSPLMLETSDLDKSIIPLGFAEIKEKVSFPLTPTGRMLYSTERNIYSELETHSDLRSEWYSLLRERWLKSIST